MIEAEAFSKLRAYLVKLDADASALSPAWQKLSDVIKAHPNAPPPSGPYATINALALRDTFEADCDKYEEREIGGDLRTVLMRTRIVEILCRVDVFASRPFDYLDLFAHALLSAHSHPETHPFMARQVEKMPRDPKLLGQEWEGRAFLDVTLAAKSTVEMLVDTIETGNITITGAGRVPVSTQIEFEKGP